MLQLNKQNKDPVSQIESGNPWYTDKQFVQQLGTPGRRAVIENRWRIFGDAIAGWTSRNTFEHRIAPVRILDIGCGDGINLHGITQAIGISQWNLLLFGVDYNPLRLNRARAINGVNGLLLGSLPRLPFSSETFDIILCNHVLEHIFDDEEALQELNRLLRRDGIMILGVPNEGCLLAKLRNRILQPQIARTTDHVQFYTTAILAERTMSAGFRIIQMYREGFFMPHLRVKNWLREKTFGRAILSACRALLPSQAAELVGIFSKN